jgi:hypothetical protein
VPVRGRPGAQDQGEASTAKLMTIAVRISACGSGSALQGGTVSSARDDRRPAARQAAAVKMSRLAAWLSTARPMISLTRLRRSIR